MLHETSMLYKLTILYILHRVDFPISNSQISNFILENDFTDYFNIQQIMGELIDDDYVKRETVRNKTLYRITDAGEVALKLLSRELSPAMKADVDSYIAANKIKFREELSVLSNFYQIGINHYNAHLVIDENSEHILELNIATTTEDEAERICVNWEKTSNVLYPIIMNTLFTNGQ